MNPPQLIKLDEQFRQYTSMEWLIDWKNISLPALKNKIGNTEEYAGIIRLGTFHPNGFFREKCVTELKDDPKALPYLILRLNDWVKPVRDAAQKHVRKQKKKYVHDKYSKIL